MPSGIRNVIILLSILTLVLIGVSIYVGLELSKDTNVDSNPADASNSCGNNICDDNETCDGIEQCIGNASYVVGDCRNNCSYCGDGIEQAGEECDDGNDDTTDGCTNNCTNPQANVNDTPTPTPEATPTPTDSSATCGNNVCEPNESCDGSTKCTGSGNFDSNTSCRLDCSYCGDGVVQAGEECDDDNTDNSDSCTNTCTINAAGDIANGNNTCGDGIQQTGEECDPGISSTCSNGLACRTSDCTCVQSNPSTFDSVACGQSCTNTDECAGDNVCESGRCVLLACSASLGGLGGNINQSGNSATVCAANGCSTIQCGDTCGVNGACPNGLSCNSNNQCVFTYCINNQCSNQCQLPATDLETDDMKLILQALVVILLGLVAYQLFIVNNSFSLLGSIRERFTTHQSSKVEKQRNRFENNF